MSHKIEGLETDYKALSTKLYLELAHHIRALRKIQGAATLKDCHRIAEAILNQRNNDE
jgi:hypothetical protein